MNRMFRLYAIEIDPCPFDTEGLVVAMPARVIPDAEATESRAQLSRLHGSSVHAIEVEFVEPKA